MAANTSPIFPLTPIVGIATLTSATAITSRANITGTTGLVMLTSTSTNGTRVDNIVVRCKGSNVPTTIGVWIYNGTTSYLFDEIDIIAITASTTQDAASVSRNYTTLVLPATYQLYISEQVQADANVFAFGGVY